MSSGKRPTGAAKGNQSDTEALCQPPLPPRRGVLCPPPTVTYKHLIEKPPLAVVRRKDATPSGYVLSSPVPQNDLLAVLMKCITQRAPHQRKGMSSKTRWPQRHRSPPCEKFRPVSEPCTNPNPWLFYMILVSSRPLMVVLYHTCVP